MYSNCVQDGTVGLSFLKKCIQGASSFYESSIHATND